MCREIKVVLFILSSTTLCKAITGLYGRGARKLSLFLFLKSYIIISEVVHFAIPDSFVNGSKAFIKMFIDVRTPEVYDGIAKIKKLFVVFPITGTVPLYFLNPVIRILAFFKA